MCQSIRRHADEAFIVKWQALRRTSCRHFVPPPGEEQEKQRKHLLFVPTRLDFSHALCFVASSLAIIPVSCEVCLLCCLPWCLSKSGFVTINWDLRKKMHEIVASHQVFAWISFGMKISAWNSLGKVELTLFLVGLTNR